jgi:hypothetical protein
MMSFFVIILMNQYKKQGPSSTLCKKCSNNVTKEEFECLKKYPGKFSREGYTISCPWGWCDDYKYKGNEKK